LCFAIILKAEHEFCVATVLFHILNKYPNKVAYFQISIDTELCPLICCLYNYSNLLCSHALHVGIIDGRKL
jgi:hypothetical protein